MTRAWTIALVVAGLVLAAAVGESNFGSTRYKVNGVTYVVPHKYEFMRNFSLPWLEGVRGLDKEPDESIWLLLPASELARDIQGYKRFFHGYSSEVEAEIVVNVLGGKEAREFPDDRREDLSKVTEQLSQHVPQQADTTSGWQRVFWLLGEKDTPGEGNSLFYLIPGGGLQQLPSNWRVPSCQSAPDINGRETYDCSFVIYKSGLTFKFDLRQENLGMANRIPDYVLSRLNQWRA